MYLRRRNRKIVVKVTLLFLSNWRASTLRKYLISFDVNENMMAALNSIKNKKYWFSRNRSNNLLSLISGFRCNVDEICGLLGYYTA
jgi:hypothetical protein